jgi:hypothetical protein
MIRLMVIILLALIVKKSIGQDSSRLISYHLAINVNYAGEKSPDHTLPIGGGIGTTVTLNKFSKFKPTIELNAAGFPEYAIHLTNNNTRDDSKYAYGIFNLLAGTKYKLNSLVKVSLTAGPSLNSIEKRLQMAARSSLELNIRKDKTMVQLYYFRVLHSEIINGYIGVAILFKIR